MGEIQHNEKGSLFLKRTKRLAWLLDSSIKIPGTRYSFGIDALVGIFPLLGDIVGMFMSFYLVLTIVIHGASGKVIVKMILNTIFDALLGAIPFLGVFFDAALGNAFPVARLVVPDDVELPILVPLIPKDAPVFILF